MVVRCIFGCAPLQVLFPIPKQPSLHARWLEFLHFEGGGITAKSRMCARHFTKECFKNLRRYEMGLVQVLHLTDTAVPSVYTVGTSMNVKPLTRDVGCQCAAKTVTSIGMQAAFSIPKPKRWSKGKVLFFYLCVFDIMSKWLCIPFTSVLAQPCTSFVI
ncbi:hypothetical protein PO909_029605 [Leuciscus waleckii]